MRVQMRLTAVGSRQRGFTLIELMIVIAILAILVALAVPAYRDYAIRSKIAECINGAAVAKVQVSEYEQSLGAWPPTQADAGISSPAGVSHYCSGFANYDGSTGAFSIDVNEAAVNPSISGVIQPTLTPTVSASGFINWHCSYGSTDTVNTKYLPSPCRGT